MILGNVFSNIVSLYINIKRSIIFLGSIVTLMICFFKGLNMTCFFRVSIVTLRIWFSRINNVVFFWVPLMTSKICFWIWIWILVFNATFSNISAISWRPVLVVEEARVPGENHRPTMCKQLVNFITLRLRVDCILFSNLQSRAQTHAVLVIGLYKLLSNPTT